MLDERLARERAVRITFAVHARGVSVRTRLSRLVFLASAFGVVMKSTTVASLGENVRPRVPQSSDALGSGVSSGVAMLFMNSSTVISPAAPATIAAIAGDRATTNRTPRARNPSAHARAVPSTPRSSSTSTTIKSHVANRAIAARSRVNTSNRVASPPPPPRPSASRTRFAVP